MPIGPALDAGEADDDVPRKRLLDFEEIALVDNFADQFLDVVGLVGVARNQRVERFIDPVAGIEARDDRRLRGV